METVQGWMYLRLSRDDLGGGESESITNQREYILQYMKNHDDILLGGEIIEDGYTGINTNRPGLTMLLEKVQG